MSDTELMKEDDFGSGELAELMTALNMKQQRFVNLYIMGVYSVKEIAKMLFVHENTVYGWLKQDAIKSAIAYYQEIERDVIKTGIQNGASKAFQTMVELMDSPQEQIRFQSSKDVLDRAGFKAEQKVKVDKTVTTFEGKLQEFITSTDFEVLD